MVPANFSITELGFWPRESYVFDPIPSVINPGLLQIPFSNNARFYNNPIFKLETIARSSANNSGWVTQDFTTRYFYTTGINISVDATIDKYVADKLDADAGFILATSAARFQLYDRYVNYFDVDIDVSAGIGNVLFTGFLFYPKRLTLKPVSVNKNSATDYRIVLNASLIDPTPMYFADSAPTNNSIAGFYNRLYRSGKYINPSSNVLPLNVTTYPLLTDNEVNFFYSISATETVINRPIYTFGNTILSNPSHFSLNVEPQLIPKRIRPDFAFIEFTVNYIANSDGSNGLPIGAPYLETLYNVYYDDPNLSTSEFNIPISHSYNPNIDPKTLTFLMVQSAIAIIPGTNWPNPQFYVAQNPANSALNIILDLESTNLRYFSRTRFNSGLGTFVNVVTGVAGTSLNFSYIIDYGSIKNTNETVANTLIPSNQFVVGSTTQTANTWSQGISSTQTGANSVTFRTKYPPHYYTYNVAINKPTPTGSMSLPKATERVNFTYHLSAYPFRASTSSVFLTAFLYSDFDFSVLDLKTYSFNAEGWTDRIRYKAEGVLPSLLNNISAYVIPNNVYANRVSYDLTAAPWVPAHQNDLLEITFPTEFAGFPQVTIRPSLSTLVGLKDAIYNTNVPLTGLYQQPQYPLYLEIINEGEDFIDVSAASLTSIFVYPGIDLTNSNISWFVEPLTDSNIKINYLLADTTGFYRPINTIATNSTLPFNINTWAIRVSGYGPETMKITLSSQKLTSKETLTSNPDLFNFFGSNTLILEPIQPLNNLEEIRTISLSAAVPFRNRKYPLPSNQTLYWNWIYDGNTLASTIPISAKYLISNTISSDYQNSENNIAAALQALYFYINPVNRSNSPVTRQVQFNCFVNDLTPPVSGKYNVVIDDFPAKNIFNADFTVAYQSHPNTTILNTRNNTYVLTRPDNGSSFYTASANQDIIPLLNAQQYQWTVVKDGGAPTIFNNVTAIYFNTNGTAKTDIKFRVLSALAVGWPFRHNIEENITIYTLNTTEFNRPTQFNIYPEFAWPNSPNLVILDDSNYNTASVAPTSYAFKTSNTETFNVSANKDYTSYRYTYGLAQTPLPFQTQPKGKITLPYSTQILSETGVFVSLTGYNVFYPPNTPLRYLSLESGNLVTRTYNITAQTIPYNRGTSSSLAFRQNPKLVDYNTIIPTFTATITSFDLDFNRIITVNQTINTSPRNTPAVPIPSNSTITYILSAPNWLARRDVPAVNGTFGLFTLNVGDSLSQLTVDNGKINTLQLNLSSNLNIQIPETTFQNYAFFQYTGNRNLWTSKNILLTANNNNWRTLVAFTTSVKPELFFNTNYSITSTPISIEFLTPSFANNPIISYAVNFGENAIQLKNANDTFTYQYSSIGTFFITYSAIYQDGSFERIINNVPIIIKDRWEEYDQENIRVLSETTLNLPYTLDEILIQPNEFGVKDIFNTSISRLHECLEYLKGNTQTMNIDAPTYYYGWLGNHIDNRSGGIRWYTESYGSNFYLSRANAAKQGFEFFTNIKDIHFGSEYIFVLDDKIFRLFKQDKNATEIKFKNINEINNFFFDPRSIAVSDDEISIFVADSVRHKIYRYDFDLTDESNAIFSLVLTLGSFGSLNESGKFDFPSELHYKNDNLYVLDFNNNCVKQYTRDLSWMHTYYDDVFRDDQIQTIALHTTGLLYVLTKSFKIHIFDTFGETVIKTIQLNEFNSFDEIVRMSFDENGEFFYICTQKTIFKYSAVGEYVTTLNLENTISSNIVNDETIYGNRNFTSIKPSKFRSMNISWSTGIMRVQDFVEIFKIGDGLGSNYWALDQILLKDEQFAQDLNYNASLAKLSQNLKTFRNTLNGVFALVTEQTPRGTVSYFTLLPINKESLPVFEPEVENEFLYVGANEFHIPTVLNRALIKIYSSFFNLKTALDVVSTNESNVTTDTDANDCGNSFCWSWKAMSCYNLSLPIIRICNINPITYAELVRSFPVNYAPTKLWGDANSVCCGDVASPLG